MGGFTNVVLATFLITFFLVLMYLVVPTEQALLVNFPNVVFLTGFGQEKLEPISFDNNTLDELPPGEVRKLNGVFQFDPLYYHKTLDRFIPWEDRDKVSVWDCTLFCSPLNTTDKQNKLSLVHYSPDPKKNLWYLIELRNDDVNSPIIYGRTKYRKQPTYRAPWTTVTAGGEIKPQELPDVYIFTAWDAFRFDTPVKWGTTVALVLGVIYWYKYIFKSDDD
mmetsp:Transcript_62333/g.115701  ORF Transcript_62333/g.115701 Transcript_62333/m.115701 type:complete len:221 (-) Transcript_62333:59-721(-)